MTKRIIRSAVALGLMASIGLVACGDDESSDTPPATDPADTPATDAASAAPPPATDAPAPSGDAALVIHEFSFSPATVQAGTEFTISNQDGFAHTVTSDTFDVRVDGGATEALTIEAPGSYSIFCKIHTQMQGTIIVE